PPAAMAVPGSGSSGATTAAGCSASPVEPPSDDGPSVVQAETSSISPALEQNENDRLAATAAAAGCGRWASRRADPLDWGWTKVLRERGSCDFMTAIAPVRRRENHT